MLFMPEALVEGIKNNHARNPMHEPRLYILTLPNILNILINSILKKDNNLPEKLTFCAIFFHKLREKLYLNAEAHACQLV